MRRIRSGFCARAASGHAAAPPRTPRNARRLMCPTPGIVPAKTIALRKGAERLRRNLEELSFDSIGPMPVVLTHPLDKQKLAFGGRFIRNAVGGARQNFVSFADMEHASIVRTTGLDGESTLQHEIMIRTLAVIVPGNDVAVSQREDTHLNVVADHNGFDVFHFVVRHLDVFTS
jgi:hypothetical protein